MGLMEFIMMKNLFGKSGGGVSNTDVMGTVWKPDVDYEVITFGEQGEYAKISNFAPSANDLVSCLMICKTGTETFYIYELTGFQDENICVLVGKDRPDTMPFIVCLTDGEYYGLPLTAGIYISTKNNTGAEYAYLIWEPTS